MLRRIVVSAVFALFAFSAEAQQPFNLTALGSAGTGILASLNSGVAAAVQAGYAGSTVTYQTGGGGIANIAAIDKGRAPLGYAVDVEMAFALQGREPFKEKIDSFRTIALLNGGVAMHFIVSKELADKYGVKDFADIAKKKVPIRMVSNQRGNVVSIVAEEFLKEIGVSPSDIRGWGGDVLYINAQDHAGLFADRRADTMLNMTNIRNAAIIDTMKSRDLVMLTIDRTLVDRVAKNLQLRTMVIPKSAYDFMTDDLYTAEIGIALIAHKDVKDEHTYAIAKSLVEHLDKFQAIQPAFKSTTAEFLTANAVGAYHPGALKAYREKGLVK